MDEGVGGTARGGGVLVVDDHAPIREFVCAALVGAGYAVREAGDGAEALRLAQEARPAVILLDIGLPGMDGRQALAAYRRGPGPHAPVVLMTAAGDIDLYAAEEGAADLLSKPFSVAELLAVVGRYVPPPGRPPDALE